MLLVEKVQMIEGVAVYADDTDRRTFYLLPETPRFRLDEAGRPVFRFFKYRDPIPREGADAGGGFVVFDAEFAVDEARRERIVEALRQQVPGGGEIKVGIVHWAKGTARINISSAAGDFVQSVWNPVSPSLFGNNITPFTIELTQKGATFFEQALQGRGGFVQVAYEMSAWVKLPPVTGTASFSSRKFYDFVQDAKDDAGCGDDEFVNKIREKVRSKEIMKVDITSGLGAEPKVVGQIRQSLYDTLEQTVAKKMTEQLGQYDGDRGVLEDYEKVTREYHKVKIDSFSYTITENSAALWPFNPGGTLPNITSLVDRSGNPIRWEDHASIIDLDDPFFRQFRLDVRVEGDLENLPINSVDVHVEFDGDRTYTEDYHFDEKSTVQRFVCFSDGKPSDFRYRYRVNFENSARAYEVPMQQDNAKLLTINIDDTGLLLVDVRKGDLDFTTIPTAVVTVRYEPVNGAPIEEQFVVDQAHPEHRLERAIFEARTKPVRYRIDYRTADGKPLSTPWQETSRQIAVNSPFRDQRHIRIRAAGNLETEVESVFLDLAYTDTANDYRQTSNCVLKKGAPDEEWVFPVIDLGGGVVTFSGTVKRYDGSIESIPVTTAVTDTIVAGEVFAATFAVQVDPGIVDFSQAALVRVELRHGADPATAQARDVVARDNATLPAVWTVELQDRTAPRTYTWSATYYLKDGTTRSVPAGESDDLVLVLPAMPPA
jgi:hypothetical protein